MNLMRYGEVKDVKLERTEIARENIEILVKWVFILA